MAENRKDHFTMTLRLPESKGRLLEAMSERLGIPKTNVISLALQEMAERKGIEEPSKQETAAA